MEGVHAQFGKVVKKYNTLAKLLKSFYKNFINTTITRKSGYIVFYDYPDSRISIKGSHDIKLL